MSIITTIPTEVDYTRQVINQARRISFAVDDYLSRELYLAEAPEEAVSSEYLKVRAIELIAEELTALGITIEEPQELLGTEVALTQLVLYLRMKFDKSNLYELIKYREDLQELLREAIEDPVDACISVINSFYQKHPLDEGWEFLHDRSLLISNDENFILHVAAILKQVDDLGALSVADKGQLQAVEQATAVLYNASTGVGRAIEQWMKYHGDKVTEDEKAYVQKLNDKANAKLMKEPWLSKYLVTGAIPLEYCTLENQYREYWINRPTEVMSLMDALLVICWIGVRDWKSVAEWDGEVLKNSVEDIINPGHEHLEEVISEFMKMKEVSDATE